MVAQSDYGDVTVYVVFDLDDLLLGGADVADVGDGEIAGDLLFYSDAGSGVLFRAGGSDFGEAGIDAKSGDAKELFESAADLTGNRFGE